MGKKKSSQEQVDQPVEPEAEQPSGSYALRVISLWRSIPWQQLMSSWTARPLALGLLTLLAFTSYNLISGIWWSDRWYSIVLGTWIAVCIVWIVSEVMRWLFRRDLPESVYQNNDHKKAVHSVIQQLRLRARGLRVASWGTMLVLVCSIVSGMIVFSQADESASSATDATAQRLSEIADIMTDDSKLLTSMERFVTQRLTESSMQVDADVYRTIFNDFGDDLTRVQETVDATKKAVEPLRAAVTQSNTNNSVSFIVASLGTKLGAVLLLLFLVQILISLYRYMLRLAAFYDARADCLQASQNGNPDELLRYMELLSADSVTFGKTPKSPSAEAFQFAQNVAQSAINKNQGSSS